ncbi:MAG: glycerophosphodiester phosphodiesterase family protein [Chloroflexota bacterium]
MLHPPEPTVTALISTAAAESPLDKELAARYAPVIRFDAREPFLPAVVGYTVFRSGSDSPSFPRRIELAKAGQPPAALAIEYAVWWDWDIQHLYELEHIWIYLDDRGEVVRAEASWHGVYHDLAVDGSLPLTGNRLTVLSEPGKHAFAPLRDWLDWRSNKTRESCTRHAGKGGVWVTPLFKGIIDVKTPQADRLVHSYLERYAFEPALEFSRIFPISPGILIPWPALFDWIPRRVAWWVAELERTIPPRQRRFLRIAHRGASACVPENTLAAIVKAAELGADLVELDVQSSAEGAPVIIHDLDLGRRTNGSGLVSRYTVDQLKQLDAGDGQTIPTLAEAITCCREQGLGLYLELKSGPVIPAVVDLLRAEDFIDHTIVASFRPDWLAFVKGLEPSLTTSVLFGAVNLDPVALARAVDARYVHPAWEDRAAEPHRLLTPAWLAHVRAAGLGIICWHEERPSEITALRQIGVDGICSNAPELLLV